MNKDQWTKVVRLYDTCPDALEPEVRGRVDAWQHIIRDWLDGVAIEVWRPWGGWVDLMNDYAHWDQDYRIKVAGCTMPDDLVAALRVLGAAVNGDWKWAAVDADGELYLYEGQPTCGRGYWDGEDFLEIGNVECADWRESLVEL